MFVLKEFEQNGAGTEKLSGKQRGFGEDTILRQNHIMGEKKYYNDPILERKIL